MLSKSQIQFIRSLRQKKFRNKHQQFIVEGEKSVRDLIQSDYLVSNIFLAEEDLIRHAKVQRISFNDLEKISEFKTPNRVLALARIPHQEIPQKEVENHLCLALDGISDPGNLGTIIRIADWFGMETILCSTTCVDGYNPKVVQSSMGSLFRIRIHTLDLALFLKGLRETPIYGAVLDGENLYHADLTSTGVIVIGEESHGISQEVLDCVQGKLTIPSRRRASSLNAGVATGILCSEFIRRSS